MKKRILATPAAAKATPPNPKSNSRYLIEEEIEGEELRPWTAV